MKKFGFAKIVITKIKFQIGRIKILSFVKTAFVKILNWKHKKWFRNQNKITNNVKVVVLWYLMEKNIVKVVKKLKIMLRDRISKA